MSSDKDTHFLGFAKLLRAELYEQLSFLDFKFSDEQQKIIDTRIERIFARYA